MSLREDIFTQPIAILIQKQGIKESILTELSNIEWINTLDAKKINELIVKVMCITDDDTISLFIKNIQQTTVKPEPLSTEQWLTIYNHANSFWKKQTISEFKHLTTGPTPRDPISKEEEILYCLATSVQASEKMPSEIIIDLLNKIDLDVKTPNYNQDALDIISDRDNGNIEYIRIILCRAIKEKSRTSLLEYIQDRCMVSHRATVKYVEELENLFLELDLPFSEVVHGKHRTNIDMLSNCSTVPILNICIKYLPVRYRDYILQSRAFIILCNFIDEKAELQKAVEILEGEKVDLLKVFEQRCIEKEMCLLDKACLNGRSEDVSCILSKMSDAAKTKALRCRNYGQRTPLAHARYYSYGNTDKENIIVAEMNRLGL